MKIEYRVTFPPPNRENAITPPPGDGWKIHSWKTNYVKQRHFLGDNKGFQLAVMWERVLND